MGRERGARKNENRGPLSTTGGTGRLGLATVISLDERASAPRGHKWWLRAIVDQRLQVVTVLARLPRAPFVTEFSRRRLCDEGEDEHNTISREDKSAQ